MTGRATGKPVWDWVRPEREVGRRPPTELEKTAIDTENIRVQFIAPEDGTVTVESTAEGISVVDVYQNIIARQVVDRSVPVMKRRWRWQR